MRAESLRHPTDLVCLAATQLTLVYTLVGGLEATFLAGYVHTSVIMLLLVIFLTVVCA